LSLVLPLGLLVDAASPTFSTVSLHDALPISSTFAARVRADRGRLPHLQRTARAYDPPYGQRERVPRMRTERRLRAAQDLAGLQRSEEHTSELQSRENLVCRLLLEKIKDVRRR